MMNIGDLYVDPADGMLMLYVGRDPHQENHFGFYCPTVVGSYEGNKIYYYADYDLKYLERLDGNQDRNID